MTDIDTHDLLTTVVKGLVYVGNKIIVTRRDTNTDLFPLAIDLPGGGCENVETPFETFQREVKEECNLDVVRNQIVCSRRYPSSVSPGKFGYFLVAKLPTEAAEQAQLGSEGVELHIMSPEEYLARTDAWPIFQDRTRDYLTWKNDKSRSWAY